MAGVVPAGLFCTDRTASHESLRLRFSQSLRLRFLPVAARNRGGSRLAPSPAALTVSSETAVSGEPEDALEFALDFLDVVFEDLLEPFLLDENAR